VQARSRSSARRVYLGLIVAVPLALGTVPVARASAALVMEAFPGAPTTNNTTPTFSGSTDDYLDPVTVNIYEGETATGKPVQTPTGSPSAISGSWSATVTTPLQDGTYTAVAEQSELGVLGQTSVTPPFTFTVDTMPPTVTLAELASRSNDTTPSFSGTASDTTPVTVGVYEGGSAEGNPIATLKVQGTGGSWASRSVSPPLADGKYTAIATQPSSLGNPTGVSNSVTFEVDTEPPTVTLTAPPSPSNDTTPSFSGTASDATQVTVKVFEGTRPEGNIVATVAAQGTRGSWSSGHVTPALPRGRHTFTAFATQTSEVKNAPGMSAVVTFVVDTEPPTVTLKALPSPSNDTTPSFSGTASDATPVTVEIFEGPKAEGGALARATATETGGSWTSGDATPALGSGTFTALATQPSAIGNPPGRSTPVTFTVDTSPPKVTLNALPSPSGNAAPSFSGATSDRTPVTVEIHEGATAEGAVVASATAGADHGEWVSDRASPSLQWGEYTAVATQPSSIGNAGGASSPMTFAVEPIAPTVATEAASAVTRTSAALYASVDPRGGGVSACHFEYGSTPSYGASIDCGFVSGISAFPPSGTAAVPVFARIYGLRPGTTYHFRIVAAGEGGTGDGADETFTTLAPWIFNEEGSSGAAASAQSGSGNPRGMAAGGVAALIARQLKPHGRTARIAALLRSGVFKAPFKAPEAGTAAIDWYYLPPAGKRAGKTARSRLLVASGGLTFPAAGTAALRIHLTGAGRRLLRHSTRIRLTATCVFTPVGATSVRTSGTFELRR
jgi:hypothetical protein